MSVATTPATPAKAVTTTSAATAISAVEAERAIDVLADLARRLVIAMERRMGSERMSGAGTRMCVRDA